MSPKLPPRYPVLDVTISATTRTEAVDLALEFIENRKPCWLSVCPADTVLQAHDHPELAAIVNGSALALPDGMPIAWLGRWQGFRVERVYGPDFMLGLCDRGREIGLRHYFYGGTEPLLAKLAANLEARFPGIRVAGSWAPPFRPLTEAEEAAVAARINKARPDVVWIGIGTPKQDYWIDRFRPELEAPLLVPVGAAFNFHAGTVRQAPGWMRRSGLEWVFRLLMEPRRLWRRYLIGNARFVLLVIKYTVAKRLGLR